MRFAVFFSLITVFIILIIVSLKGWIGNVTLKKLVDVATIVTPIAAILTLIIPQPIRNPATPLTSSSNSKVYSPNINNEEESLDYRLSEEQKRREISNFLEKDNVDEAIRFLNLLQSKTAKDEECDHIFNFCLKNGKLDKAEETAKLFVSSSKKEKALNDIALEKVKK